MTPEELELRLLSSIVGEEDLLECKNCAITKLSFAVEKHGEVYEYLESHARQHGGALPTREDVASLFGVVLGEPGDLKAYIERVKDAEIARRAGSVLSQEILKLNDNPREAVNQIINRLSELKISTVSKTTYLDKDAEVRLARFDAAKKTIDEGGMLGLPTGLKTLDMSKIGWLRGELVIVMGSMNVGKSWLLMKFCTVAYEQANCRVLFVSPEMSAEEQAIRFDAMLSAMRGQSMTATGILRAEIERERYADWLKGLSSRSDFIVKDASDEVGMLTFEDIWDWTLEFKPDLVAIDGLHLLDLRNNSGLAGWEVLKRGCAMLKNLAQQTGIVVIAAHQPDRSATKNENLFIPPRLSQTGYGIAVAQSADVVLSMARSKDAPMERVYTLEKLRSRPQMPGVQYLLWDVNNGIIEDIADAENENF